MVILAALPLAAQSSVLAPIPASNAIPEGQTFLIKLNDKLVAVGQANNIASSIFRDYLVPFEVVSMLLLAALVGAVVIARRD